VANFAFAGKRYQLTETYGPRTIASDRLLAVMQDSEEARIGQFLR
jgi:hypothetical protein